MYLNNVSKDEKNVKLYKNKYMTVFKQKCHFLIKLIFFVKKIKKQIIFYNWNQ